MKFKLLVYILSSFLLMINIADESDYKDVFIKPNLNDYKPILTKKSIDELIQFVEFNKLPKKVNVSTMTIACKIGTPIYLENVARFLNLHVDRIHSIKYGSHPLNNRTIIVEKKKKKTKEKKKKKNFYNEATIKIKPTDNKAVNVKLFKNESLQLTGVKNMNNFCEIISKLFFELKKKKYVMINENTTDENDSLIMRDNKMYRKRLVLKPFIHDESKLQLYDVQICMINTNFKVQNNIDRGLLYEKLLLDGIYCTFDPTLHACVNIKYDYSAKKKVSIFVFQSGAIIITGSNCINHVVSAYNFLKRKFATYGTDVILAGADKMLTQTELKKYLK